MKPKEDARAHGVSGWSGSERRRWLRLVFAPGSGSRDTEVFRTGAVFLQKAKVPATRFNI